MSSLSKRWYWRGMQRDCRAFIRACARCQAAKVSTQKPQGLLQPLPTPDAVFEECSLDFITHLPVTAAGHNSIVTFVDRLSKYVYFVACRHDITAEQLANVFLATVVARHGLPRRLVSDRDPRFTSRFWKALTGALGV